MPYAEVIYEDGSNSLVAFESEEELQEGLANHHQRALDGAPGAAQDQTERTDLDPSDFTNMPPLEFMMSRPAVRIHEVNIYEEDPTTGYTDKQLDAKAVTELVKGMTDQGTVDMEQLIQALRDEASPVYPVTQGQRASIWKAEGTPLDLGFLPTAESEA
jgi:hypothetical protein